MNDSTQQPERELREVPEEATYTMTEAEYAEALQGARKLAWDEGWDAAAGWPQVEENPYAERKMTPAEIEEWRKTCPYPEALGQ